MIQKIMINELRPGNIIEKRFAPSGEFKWSFYRVEEYKEIQEFPEYFRFATLTDEWLERFQFTYDEKNDDYRLGNIAIYLPPFEGMDETLEFIDKKLIINPPLKYVHNLQNIFLDLTGEKLQLKY